jgi:hypothetical protein
MRAYGDRFSAPIIAAGWVAFVSLAGVVFSLALACAAPLAAIAALGGIHLNRRLALALAATAWLANQAVGFLVLRYPTDPTTVGWGIAIGTATLVAAEAARLVFAGAGAAMPLLRIAAAFVAAFVAYEVALYAAGCILVSSEDAFSLETVLFIFGTNLLGLVLLEGLRRVALVARVFSTSSSSTTLFAG